MSTSKYFGYHANQLYFNMRAPAKVKTVMHPAYGVFDIPKNKKTTNIKDLYSNYAKKEDMAKYLNPKGIKPTITSRFP